jgi:hypothetical protein
MKKIAICIICQKNNEYIKYEAIKLLERFAEIRQEREKPTWKKPTCKICRIWKEICRI